MEDLIECDCGGQYEDVEGRLVCHNCCSVALHDGNLPLDDTGDCMAERSLIAERAYELFQSGVNTSDIADWYQAEAELAKLEVPVPVVSAVSEMPEVPIKKVREDYKLDSDISSWDTNNLELTVNYHETRDYRAEMRTFTFRGGRLNTWDEVLVLYCQLMRSGGYTQTEISNALRVRGYTAKSGITLTNSHVSNFMRKDLDIRSVPEYVKPNYQGKNWHTFA